jgi:hypothetical protein
VQWRSPPSHWRNRVGKLWTLNKYDGASSRRSVISTLQATFVITVLVMRLDEVSPIDVPVWKLEYRGN